MAERRLTTEDRAAARVFAEAVKACGKPHEQIAAEIGVTTGMIHQWTKPLRPVSVKRAPAAAAAVGIDDPAKISVDYARWAEESPGITRVVEVPATNAPSGWIPIRASTQGLGLGRGVEAVEYAETHNLLFRANSLRRKSLNSEACEIAYGSGDSMLPRIQNGDAILFNTKQIEPRDGKLFVIEIEGRGANREPQVKRCNIIDDIVYFEALNPDGDHTWKKPRRMDHRRNPIRILGQVRWIGSWED